MSYTPEDQKIEDVTKQLIDNIKKFREVAENRLMSSGWSNSHLLDLNSLSKKLFEIQIELKQKILS